ncbi:hypothetical protein CCHOA_11585 [Corynebacterium choanae]|uniref:Transposase n=1 Tax=Corynebacterium choanae TaxID=1862358 RepID=A0A3G6JCA6_9CORY|nr:hypothetical protein CCHOA_11585 [Corynebacterium choanae]
MVRAALGRGKGITLVQIAHDFVCHEMTLSKWFRAHRTDEGSSAALGSAIKSQALRFYPSRTLRSFTAFRVHALHIFAPVCSDALSNARFVSDLDVAHSGRGYPACAL